MASFNSEVDQRGSAMGMVRDCRDFDRVWNERLDDRTKGDDWPGRSSALADHSAECEACRSRALIYAEFEGAALPWAAIPSPTFAAIERWEATAVTARSVAGALSTRGHPSRRGLASRFGLAAAVAVSILISSQSLVPFLFPLEAAPLPRIDRSSRLFEEAVTEATSMTWELAREVSAPAARISSEALGWRSARFPLVAVAPPIDPTETPVAPEWQAPGSPSPADPALIESISGSARHAFQFLIMTTSEEGSAEDESDGL